MNRYESFDKYFNRKEFNKFPAKERDAFLSVLQHDLQENGLTERNIPYILRGNSINTAKVFCEWLCTFYKSEEFFQHFEHFINSAEFSGAKKDLKFSFLTKIMANLFGEDERYYKVLYGILEVIQDYIYSSPGVIDPQKVNIFGRNFLAFANPESGFPDKEAIGLKGTTGLQKKRLLSSVFYAAGSNAKKGKSSYVNQLKAWLNDNDRDNSTVQNEDDRQVISGGDKIKNAEPVDAQTDQLPQNKTDKTKSTVPNTEETSLPQEKTTSPDSVTNKKTKKLSARTRLTRLLNEYFDEVTSREEEYRLVIERLQNENAEKEEEIEQNAAEIKTLTQKVQEAKDEVRKLKAQIHKLEIGMKKQESISNIVQADLKNSSDERLKALGSKLKGQYEDYLSACDLEITQDIACDMAEMLKSQLHDIFEILMNDGIELYRR